MPSQPLSIGENHRSLTVSVLELFRKQWSTFYFETDNKTTKSNTLIMNMDMSEFNNVALETHISTGQNKRNALFFHLFLSDIVFRAHFYSTGRSSIATLTLKFSVF